jgi:drug/metabolite transporter (DMT)-like permease
MSSLVVLVVLAAAVMHASWNALAKHGGDPVLRIALMHLACCAIALVLVPLVEAPAAAAWPFLAGSVAIHVVYQALLANAYRWGDLSQVYPITRGIAPSLVALAAVVVAGETLPWAGVLAVLVTAAGIMALALVGRREARAGLPVGLAIANGAVIAAYSICDGLGARASGDPIGYAVWLFVFDGLIFGMVILWRRRHGLGQAVRPVLLPAVLGGVLAMAAYGAVIWAMARAPLAYVSALRETSVVIGVLIGTRLMGERLGGPRLASACLVALGVGLLHFVRAP